MFRKITKLLRQVGFMGAIIMGCTFTGTPSNAQLYQCKCYSSSKKFCLDAGSNYVYETQCDQRCWWSGHFTSFGGCEDYGYYTYYLVDPKAMLSSQPVFKPAKRPTKVRPQAR